MNFLFISPNFPIVYSKFVSSLKRRGFNVLGIGDSPYWDLNQELKLNLAEYYCVTDMKDIDKMSTAIRYFETKYGHIDYLESNNEYWLMNDAILRERFKITTGLYPSDMDRIKKKSEMKSYFQNAGVKVARYILVSTIEESKKFIEVVGYPVFVKPNIGVGAIDSFAIHGEQELIAFHLKKLDTQYIMEEFLDGEIVSFDGICNSKSKALIAFNEVFPVPVADIVNEDLDDYYYAITKMDNEFEEMGRKVVESFEIKKRCFHIEFFKLHKDRPGLANKGEIVALEVNMRPPGGYTPDLLSIALGSSFYDAYADIIMFDELKADITKQNVIAITASRKDIFKYERDEKEILQKYKDSIVEYGRYPKGISLAMGDLYYYAKFDSLSSALEYAEYIRKKKQL
ncbi:MAG: carbamoylphosphate synthase large subunit [Erysipelotrichaceae bacterium]|nr:carbamoylphosphate synthase large subunit [Erysipelotrichaceae bacterium]